MKTAKMIMRLPSSKFGTFGRLDDFFSLELPWKDNLPKVSCIPEATYFCDVVRSPRMGNVYQIFGVPGRSHCLIHSGNYAGDVSLGLRSHVQGCVLLGCKVGTLDRQPAVLVSKTAVRRFMESMEYKPFKLEVTHA